MVLIKDFNFNFQIVHSFHTLLQYTSEFYAKPDSDILVKLVFALHTDLLKTEAVILYSPPSISIALVLVAAEWLELPKLSDPDFDLSKAPYRTETVWFKRISLEANLGEIEATMELLSRALED